MIHKKYEKGFTLIEILISLGLASMISAMLSAIFISLNLSYTKQNSAINAQQELRAALNIMVTDIRMTGLDPKNTAQAGIEELYDTKIRFTSDRNLNGQIDTSDFEIMTYDYRQSSKKIMQYLYEGTTKKNSQTFLENVSSFCVKAYYAEGSESINLDDIKLVSISIAVDMPSAKGAFVKRSLNTMIKLRNL
jgi:prepilin-type N-terminal cleavage/methylation domain-containing protein